MAYGAKAGTNYEGIQIASLPPGIYKNYELVDVKSDQATKQDGSIGKSILTFIFDGAEGPFQHTEWEVDATDSKFEEKSDNQVKRIGHILSKFISKEIIDANNATDWASYKAWVMTALGSAYKGVKVDFKVIGNVYQGKATSDFPNYLGFIVKAAEPISFSASEIAANAAYAKATAATPDSESGAVPVQGGGPVTNDF